MKYIFIAINYFEKYFKQFCSLLKKMDTYETEFINAKINEIRILYIFILFFYHGLLNVYEDTVAYF